MLNNRNLILDKFEFRYYFNDDKILDLVHFRVHTNIVITYRMYLIRIVYNINIYYIILLSCKAYLFFS